ncbi:MAG TPA: tRNA (N6-threonylcarbamoyladenosine(37)-N6)-methyltransferase TrmO [Dissulfurispiraceae bacterium]|nr:tRNA (N6-threonylcarbamoyladenosine(37)-N6)-methyltransferase TrmO [Dissulfurispiraceae bacterium]
MTDVTFRPIGVIHSPFANPAGMPIQPSSARGTQGTIELEPVFLNCLADLSGFSHLILIYHFHLSEGYTCRLRPFLDSEERGLFATRAPRRPNPLGLSIVRLQRIEGTTLYIEDLDILDGTPLLDIKPYVPQFDAPDSEISIGWLQKNLDALADARSDGRFTR